MKLQNKINKTTATIILLTSLVTSLWSCTSTNVNSGSPGLDLTKEFDRIESKYTYKNLATLDLDQISDILREKTSAFEKQRDIQVLREAALIVFSRPDEDGLIEKIISEVRNPLEEEIQWQNTIEAVARQSVETIKNETSKQSDQVTAGVVLENIVAEFKPAFIKQYKNGGFETDVINFVADSNVAYSKAASKERSLYLMRNNLNPSQIAKKIQAVKNNTLASEKK